jgi:hypothetical protein
MSMYERTKIERDRLAQGIFRIAYGVDAPFENGETVYWTFLLLAEAIRKMGGCPDAILRMRNQASRTLASGIMISVDRLSANTHPDDSEFPHLVAGLNELLSKLFTETDGSRRRAFLEQLANRDCNFRD